MRKVQSGGAGTCGGEGGGRAGGAGVVTGGGRERGQAVGVRDEMGIIDAAGRR